MSQRKRGFTAVTEEDWQVMKDLFIKERLTNDGVREKTGRGAGTVMYVKLSKTYEDYKRISRQYSNFYKTRREKHGAKQRALPREKHTLEEIDLPGYKETLIVVPKEEYKPPVQVEENFSRLSEVQKSDYEMLNHMKLLRIIVLLEQIVENTKPPKRKFGFFW